MRIRDWTSSIKPNVQMCTPASGGTMQARSERNILSISVCCCRHKLSNVIIVLFKVILQFLLKFAHWASVSNFITGLILSI